MSNNKGYESPKMEIILMMEDVIRTSLVNGGSDIGYVGGLPPVSGENNP